MSAVTTAPPRRPAPAAAQARTSTSKIAVGRHPLADRRRPRHATMADGSAGAKTERAVRPRSRRENVEEVLDQTAQPRVLDRQQLADTRASSSDRAASSASSPSTSTRIEASGRAQLVRRGRDQIGLQPRQPQMAAQASAATATPMSAIDANAGQRDRHVRSCAVGARRPSRRLRLERHERQLPARAATSRRRSPPSRRASSGGTARKIMPLGCDLVQEVVHHRLDAVRCDRTRCTRLPSAEVSAHTSGSAGLTDHLRHRRRAARRRASPVDSRSAASCRQSTRCGASSPQPVHQPQHARWRASSADVVVQRWRRSIRRSAVRASAWSSAAAVAQLLLQIAYPVSGHARPIAIRVIDSPVRTRQQDRAVGIVSPAIRRANRCSGPTAACVQTARRGRARADRDASARGEADRGRPRARADATRLDSRVSASFMNQSTHAAGRTVSSASRTNSQAPPSSHARGQGGVRSLMATWADECVSPPSAFQSDGTERRVTGVLPDFLGSTRGELSCCGARAGAYSRSTAFLVPGSSAVPPSGQPSSKPVLKVGLNVLSPSLRGRGLGCLGRACCVDRISR